MIKAAKIKIKGINRIARSAGSSDFNIIAAGIAPTNINQRAKRMRRILMYVSMWIFFKKTFRPYFYNEMLYPPFP
jgi:hypothetical protein